MPIRSRRYVARTATAPHGPVWPGLHAWLISVAASLAVFALLAALAWRPESATGGRLPDITTLFVVIPAGGFALFILIAAVWTIVARTSLTSNLAFLARIAPVAWIFPCLDLLRSAGQGAAIVSAPFDATGFLLAAVTGTLLPLELALPFGMRVGLFAVTLLGAFFVWFSTRNIIRSVIAAVIVSGAAVKLTLAIPLIGIQRALLHGQWIGNAAEVPRQALLAVTNGYWWNNLYERFPSAVEAQASLALRLSVSGIIVLVLGAFLVALCVWKLPSWRRIATHAFYAWRMLDLALYALGAAFITVVTTATPVARGTWWLAALLALFLLCALRLHTALERGLSRQGRGEDDVLLTNDLDSTSARDLSLIVFLFSLAAAWILGWPIFGATVVFLATARLSRDMLWATSPWVGTLFRALGAASLALAGSFFMAQNARLSGIAVVLMLLAALHRVGMEFLWKHRVTG